MAKKGTKKSNRKRKKSSTANKLIKWAIFTGICGLIILCGAICYLLRQHPNVVVDRNEYPVMGIDISKHNGDINYDTLATDSLDFIIIKATDGNQYVDPKWEHNYQESKRIGLKVGAYHFFRMSKNGTVQAHNFLNAVKNKNIDLPLVIDVEEWGNDIIVDRNASIKQLITMVKCLKENGHSVMIYTNKDGYKKFIKDQLSEEMLWICTFQHPSKVTRYNWTLLQYSHWGEVGGIQGEVDLDVFNGDRLAWHRWLQSVK